MANAGTAFLTAMPLIIGGMVESLQMTVEMAGLMAASHLSGAATGALVCFAFTTEESFRRLIVTALGIQVFGELWFINSQSEATFALARFLSGVGAGLLCAISYAVVAGMRYKESIFAALLFGQMVFGFIWFSFWTNIVGSLGFKLSLLSIPLIGLPLVPFLRFLPAPTEDSAQSSERHSLPSLAGLLCLLSLLFHYLANSSEWIYLERIGTEAGLSLSEISSSISLSMIFGLVGTILAITVGRTKYRFLPLNFGIIGIILGTSLLLTPLALTSFTFATSIILMSLMFVIPFYQGFLADLPNGSQMSMVGAGTINVGLALGPLLGSQIVAVLDFRFLLHFCNLLYIGALILVYCAFYLQKNPRTGGSR